MKQQNSLYPEGPQNSNGKFFTSHNLNLTELLDKGLETSSDTDTCRHTRYLRRDSFKFSCVKH